MPVDRMKRRNKKSIPKKKKTIFFSLPFPIPQLSHQVNNLSKQKNGKPSTVGLNSLMCPGLVLQIPSHPNTQKQYIDFNKHHKLQIKLKK